MNLLIGLHVGLGELGALAFLWVFVELLNPNKERITRAQKAVLIGVYALLAAWFIGGWYYVATYGPIVKPIIKAGPYPWAHGIAMEAKEHIFIFIPILALVVYKLIESAGNRLEKEKKTSRAIATLSLLIVILSFTIAGMGYFISSGARAGYESQSTTQNP
ncbi:MAG: hypothetical protein COU07_02930 [Candidatus Harrisonbacteria bacterium CG10_big_fil_rev_8_21_14_0_10_40_38]|uniref:Uncharacterized protein n=1 Tax=Candidatus Harrisonbacteria bacterium CG10_big_fil_rev_8_21_14_0_10_40_38 TaxID=1974583 RepID=A0A2H0URW5_9BACT|nr:MAG: hypothetical protein COU07_02930 [Candidatus Harrisonbacteria bacterium CG10_big_fil_rev_8_21_14_0_10_40_38]